MKLAVMQPYFFPYLGYFQLIHSVDHFMFFNDVQYIRKSWMSRNRLLNIQKNVPFYIRPELIHPEYKALLPIVEVEQNGKWEKTLLEQLKVYKNRAPFYSETFPLIESILSVKYKYLSDLNIESTIQIASWVDIDIKFDRYTDYNFWFEKASHYINAPGGESFIFPEAFEANGIKLGFIQPELKSYDQNNHEFIPGLSVIDVLMFNGKEKIKDLIKKYKVKWCN